MTATPRATIAARIETDFGRRLEALRTAAARTTARADDEAIHDVRVATRRLGALLRVWGEALDPESRAWLRRRLRRLRRRLGTARELEVQVHDLAARAAEESLAPRLALEGLLGRWRFLSLYLISGLAGSVGVLWLGDPRTGVVGASGAIFGLLGAFLVIQRRLGGNATQLLILLGINLVIGFIPGFNIAWQAHLGGLVAGALVGFIFVETRKRDQRGLQIGLLVGLTLVLLLLSLRYFFFPIF